MSDQPKDREDSESLSLENCSLDEVIDALTRGSTLALPGAAGEFALAEDDSRSLLRFYAGRRDLWVASKPVLQKEVDEVLAALERIPDATTKVAAKQRSQQRPRWRLVRVQAHRFAGLHRHCDDHGNAPDPFRLEVDREITCIWGFNGAGKTALQSAILWCLTGQALRSQHQPDQVHEPLEALLQDDSADGGVDRPARSLSMPPIVPLPSAADLTALNDRPAADTWVALTLRDSTGREIEVKRSLTKGSRGGWSIPVQGLDELALPQIAIEAGTLMPAIAAAMRFQDRTSFASAIAQLTGLQPLQELGRRAARLEARFLGDEQDKTRHSMTGAATNFIKRNKEFIDAWTAHKELLGLAPALPSADQECPQASCTAAIASARELLEQAREGGARDFTTLLGRTPAGSTDQSAKLLSILREAQEALGNRAISTLRTMIRLKQLDALDEATRVSIRMQLTDLRDRAVEQVRRSKDIARTARWQLYALVAQWHRQQHIGDAIEDCPVCGSDLSAVPPDALLDTAVAEALRKSLAADAGASKNLQQWHKDAASELLESLDEPLKVVAGATWPRSLIEAYRTAFLSEMLESSTFSGTLAPIKANASTVWDLVIEQNPLSAPPEALITVLPPELNGTPLAQRFTNLQAAMLLAEHREGDKEAIKAVVHRYLGTGTADSSTGMDDHASIREAPLRTQLKALTKALEAAQPITELIRQLTELDELRLAWQNAKRRHQALERAANGIHEFTKFPDLVHQQVGGLIDLLETRTATWLDRLYRAHYVGGPRYVGLDPMNTQGIGLYAGVQGLRVQAHQVMNASHLRACVWAFVFSLWERIRDSIGAIDLLLLDDPQTHFDPINAEHLANAMPALAAAGMRPILTSNDLRFLSAVRAALPQSSTGTPSWTQWRLSPISSSRSTAGLDLSSEEILERRNTWRDDSGDTTKAQEFVERVRIHVENRLWDLLASDPSLMHKPTLANLMGHIANARNAGEVPFNEPPFQKLTEARSLRQGSQFYTIINRAHHDLRHVTPQDAADVDANFSEIDQVLKGCSAAYARFMGRLSRDDDELFFASPPPCPEACTLSSDGIPIVGDFSARSSADALAAETLAGVFHWSDISDVALYVIRGSSLGMLALQGQIVLASLNAPAKNGAPVIALHGKQVLARRLHADKGDMARIALVCDQSGNEDVAPALMAARNKVRAMPIVGIMYDSASTLGSGEAFSVDSSPVLGKPLVAARIVDDSGYPVIRDGDLALLEAMDLPEENSLDRMKGDIVALVVSQHGEYYAYLKRVGSSIGDGRRIFENIGTQGDSIVIATSLAEQQSERFDPSLHKIWRVQGVVRQVG